MGRPREHGEPTRRALLDAAERILATEGPDALSVRAVAEAVGTTTRAVYSLFGSKEGLVVALATRAFELLEAGLEAMKETEDPAADLVEVGVSVFRRFVVSHPSLYRIAFQRVLPGLRAEPDLVEARSRVFPRLQGKVQRLEDSGLLRGEGVLEATVAFNALCEGLANAELRGTTLPILPPGGEIQAWRSALWTLVRGFGVSELKPRGRTTRPQRRR